MESTKKGKLYLIPTPLAANALMGSLPPLLIEIICNTQYFLAENLRTSRRFISSLNKGISIESLHFSQLDKKTSPTEIAELMEPALKGFDIGLMSEAGCPGVADPGSIAVAYAHQMGIRVVPLIGPSSVLLSLMASGFNGQSFVFHGYLPIDRNARIATLKKLESECRRSGQTQVFIETPYRNMNMLEDILNSLAADSRLCIACNITAEDEMIVQKKIIDWKKSIPDLDKKPTIFLIGR